MKSGMRHEVLRLVPGCLALSHYARSRTICRLPWGKFESVGEGAVQLGEFERRQGRHEVSKLALKHQCQEIATDDAGAWQAIFWPQHDFGSESKDFPINRGADYGRNIFVLGDKGSGYDDIKTWFSSTLWNAFTRSVDLASRHERACSAISARAWRARRFRCFRKIAPSLASVARFRAFSAYWRNAARTSAPRLLCRGKVSASSSRSLSVASSIAIVFMRSIIAIILHCAQDSSSGR